MGIPDEDVARVRAATDIVALIGEHAAPEATGSALGRPVPVPRREDAVVQRERGGGRSTTASGAPPRATPSPSSGRSSISTSWKPCAAWPTSPGSPSTRMPRVGRDGQRRKVLLDDHGAGHRVVPPTTAGRDDAGTARDYLRSRGYEGEVVRRFRLGWAPDDWDALCSALGLSSATAAGSGPRVRQPEGSVAGCLPVSHPVPHLRSIGTPGGTRRPGTTRQPGPGQVQELRRRRRSTPSARRSTHSTGPSRTSSRSDEVVVCEGYTDVIGLFERRRGAGGGHLWHRVWPRST